jgi:ubiquinone/menaquinone biosynthesis C-methylase UbiE
MLPRMLEPEVMDTVKEARDYDAMDHTQVNRVFVDDFLAIWDGRGPVLDVGTGPARIPIELCWKHDTVKVVAVDLAARMIDLAIRNVRQAGFEWRIRLQNVDAKQMSPLFPDREFPAIMSNSIVHHIPDPRAVFAEIARVVMPGGTVFVRDLLRPTDLATLRQLVDTYARDANEHQRKMFAESLHAALTVDEVRELVKGVGYDPSGVRQTTDRHWTWAVRPG